MTPQSGQIWREVDPRKERHIRIIRIGTGEALIETVIHRGGGEWIRKPKTRETFAFLNRFDGKRNGYQYIKG